MLAQSLALRVTGPRTAKDWGVENGRGSLLTFILGPRLA